ncbi:hypothetical protein IGI04_036887 [Brassica rapa subsp. trilocularis]|uniref:Uncharacterized protein n=1 Tax=Brassica rapa subsp. trilocularis TaxID=1813537 RepID=A0ABQ7LFS5_BRACM|nr:hypothetical protein IGI04_036887 [Brassica rapa subsp. trilocularis]
MDQNEIRESLEEEVSELNFPRSPRDSRPCAAAVAGRKRSYLASMSRCEYDSYRSRIRFLYSSISLTLLLLYRLHQSGLPAITHLKVRVYREQKRSLKEKRETASLPVEKLVTYIGSFGGKGKTSKPTIIGAGSRELSLDLTLAQR